MAEIPRLAKTERGGFWAGVLGQGLTGSFLTIGACIYAPLAALLFVDFFLVRKQRISLRAAYGQKGHDAYKYTKGFNFVGLLYFLLNQIPAIKSYTLRDRDDITI